MSDETKTHEANGDCCAHSRQDCPRCGKAPEKATAKAPAKPEK